MRKIVSSILIAGLLASFGYIFFEPQLTKAVTDEVTVTLSVTSEITISAPANVTMSPAIPGMTGGTSSGSAQWTVTTNDTSGYNLKLKASTSPALATGSYNFTDYTVTTSTLPDYTWSVAASASEFGYTVSASTTADLDQSFLDNASSLCNTGSTDTADKCWLNASTTDETIVNRTSLTASSGENSVVKFQAQVGSTSFQEEGSYTATITLTAATN